jgi:hypothetical protein
LDLQSPRETNNIISPQLLQHLYTLCYNFSASLIGKKKTREMLKSSHEQILPYFQVLSAFKVTDKNELRIELMTITDKELLGFTVWIQQFIKELRRFMVGLGKLTIESITTEIKDELEEVGFYEYYKKATELEY